MPESSFKHQKADRVGKGIASRGNSLYRDLVAGRGIE